MPNTSGGTPYVNASDLVASYPTTSLALANKVDTKIDYALPVNAQTGTTYTFALADGLRLTTASNGSAQTFTIPPQSSVTWLANTVIRVVNYGAGALTINGGVGVTVTNTASTIPQFGSAAAIRTGSNAWTLVPFSGGASTLRAADVSGTTGSPTITTSGGFTVYQFTGSGSITLTKAGLCDALLVAGGAGCARSNNSSQCGGGAGGVYSLPNILLPSGNQSITVGAGGNGVFSATNPTSGNGNSSVLGTTFEVGGGGPAQSIDFTPANWPGNAFGGGNGGGRGAISVLGSTGTFVTAQGAAGGLSSAGKSSSITGTSITYGTARSSGAGAANTGDGGGASNANGGSGIVIIRVLA